MNFRKINKEEFEKLKRLFPGNEKMWIKYLEMRLQEFDKKEIDVFVIEDNGIFIGEITAEYVSHELETETIPNKRAYLSAFRVDKKYRNQGLGQKLINYCIEYLVEKRYTQFTIGVEDDNKNAKHIYFKLGFTDAIDKGAGDEFDPSEYTLYLMDVEKLELEKDIEKLINVFNEDTSFIVIPKYKNRFGNPVIYPKKYKEDILNLEGDKGGKSIIKSSDKIKYVDVCENTLFDIDNIDYFYNLL